MSSGHARFPMGKLVRHQLFGYRGVIVDVDADFQLSEDWYEQVARSRPPKDEPWYHVLVHDTDEMTYVAEQNLALDTEATPIRHPLLDHFLGQFENGGYTIKESVN